jgi:hypothetical protein
MRIGLPNGTRYENLDVHHRFEIYRSGAPKNEPNGMPINELYIFENVAMTRISSMKMLSHDSRYWTRFH